MGRMNQTAERKAWTEFVEAQECLTHAPSRPDSISFMVLCKAAPQGSMRGIPITKANGAPGAILKCDNPRTVPYRQQVGWAALEARSAAGVHEVFAGHDVPICLGITFVFAKPKSVSKLRTRPVVKPDIDKLTRSTTDALTGILYQDDCQVVDSELHKIYGTPEAVFVCVRIVKEEV